MGLSFSRAAEKERPAETPRGPSAPLCRLLEIDILFIEHEKKTGKNAFFGLYKNLTGGVDDLLRTSSRRVYGRFL